MVNSKIDNRKQAPCESQKGVQMMCPFFVDYKEVTNEVDMDGVNIQYHKIGKIYPDCSRYFLILYLL